MKTSEKIKKEKQTLYQNGVLKHDSYFHVVFQDDSEIKEHEYSWNEMSEEKLVDFAGTIKVAKVLKYPIKSLTIKHGKLETTVTPKKGESVYQSLKSRTTFKPDGSKHTELLGRVIGIVNNGKVIEERFLPTNSSDGVIGIKI